MNTSRIGEISAAQILAALITAGKHVWCPWGDSNRADLAIEREDGSLARVQCKTGRIIRGAIYFPTSSTVARSRSGRKTIRTSYRGQVEFFGVYCPDNRRTYLVPVNEVPANEARLRVEPPKNNQKTRIRWAMPYEIG